MSFRGCCSPLKHPSMLKHSLSSFQCHMLRLLKISRRSFKLVTHHHPEGLCLVRETQRGGFFFFFLSLSQPWCHVPPPTISPPTHPPVAPCPAALSCLCSHHNKPGADGALLCLAGSDGQPLSANSLLGNQLTGLDSARCFYHFSSPSVGGAGRQGGSDTAEEYRGDKAVGGVFAGSRLEISLQTAPCVSPRRPGTERIHERQIAVNSRQPNPLQDRIPPPPPPPPPLAQSHWSHLFLRIDANIWIKELRAWEHRTGMPTRWEPRGGKKGGTAGFLLGVFF